MTVEYLHLPAGGPVPAAVPRGAFKAVVLVEQVVEAGWQEAVSDWLAASGCLYMMAWGRDCSSWDDSVDYASRKRFPGSLETPDEAFIMTTWHDEDSMEEVFWYAQFSAFDPYQELPLTIVVDIVEMERRDSILTIYEKAKTLVE